MALKKYTLYFKGKNKKGKEMNVPIVSLELKKMDEFTTNYNNSYELFNDLPKAVKKFLKEEFCFDVDFESNNYFFISDTDFDPIMDVLYKEDSDILYVKQDELRNIIVTCKMTIGEYQDVLRKKFNIKVQSKKYEFFKYLYDNHVKGTKLKSMIDTYDAKQKFPELSKEELLIASIATDRDNIFVLCKKMGQYLETRRNLALKFKQTFNIISDNSKFIEEELSKERRNSEINVSNLKENMLEKLEEFIKKYDSELVK